MIRSRVSSRVKRLRAEWVVIKVMNYIIRHIFALSNGWSAAVDRFRDRREHLLRGGSFCP
jgi:hypothetical protein